MEKSFSIGHYQIKRSLGKGGMGEVFLAYDPFCGREVALKQIREELRQSELMQNRFLKEARIAAQLTHPSIIPIYSITESKEETYYTMLYAEGETLKSILRTALQQEKKGEILHPIGASVPTLCRIFLNVCQGMRYAHARGVLHRDLKPENIIVGKYGEVLILDWGLSKIIGQSEEKELLPEILGKDLTRAGKIPGTITYMAPEGAFGEAASFQTDIYALGVILYQLLTLRLPFQRSSLQQMRSSLKHETLIDPSEAAPYRDISLELTDIVKKCLHKEKALRYKNMENLIDDLQHYIEGKPQWLPAAHLKIENKKDWEFQENVLLAKHIAISSADATEWVSLMVSKASFSGNTKIQARLRLGSEGKGIGFLLSIPEEPLKQGIQEGDCLWLGALSQTGCKLFRSQVEVLHAPDSGLIHETWHEIRIEKSDKHLRGFIDNRLVLNYISHIPMTGTHIGLLYRDADFQIEDFTVFIGSQNITVNCLAVPDAFLASKEYKKALAEYRRIAYSFPGRAEGREALFRSGVTLLEEAAAQKNKKSKKRLLEQALEAFSKLRFTPGAPLEYLGKSLVYKATEEIEEEMKCLELALRKYPKHPLLVVLKEHIVFRLHETSHRNRLAAYHFALLALRYLPEIFTYPDNKRLIESLKNHWEHLFFAEGSDTALTLAFWLAKPSAILEMAKTMKKKENALFCLLELGCLKKLKKTDSSACCGIFPEESLLAFSSFKQGIEYALQTHSLRSFSYVAETALTEQKGHLLFPYFEKVRDCFKMSEERLVSDALFIFAFLQKSRFDKAQDLLEPYLEIARYENSPLYFLLGCFLWHMEGEKIAMAHFGGVSDAVFPQTPALLAHFLLGSIDLGSSTWNKQAFFWEKLQLYRQLALFYQCAEKPKKADFFYKKIQQELRHVRDTCPSS